MSQSSLILLLCLASTLFMTGVIAFVDRVHYPLFENVGIEGFRKYHREHTRRTTYVVIAPMVVELLASVWLVIRVPKGVSPALMVAGLALAVGTWGVTFLGSVPMHDRLANGFDTAAHRTLVRTNALRAICWAGHSAVLMVAMARLLP
jgi:hypothetical protein